jgi:hypothetical protein
MSDDGRPQVIIMALISADCRDPHGWTPCAPGDPKGVHQESPLHDGVLIGSPLDRLEANVAAMQDAMREASRIVLDGFELSTDAAIVRHPDRYMDERGSVIWHRVMDLLDRAETSREVLSAAHRGAVPLQHLQVSVDPSHPVPQEAE